MLPITCDYDNIVYPIVNSFIQLVRYLFSLPEVRDNRLAFLSQAICQDPLETFFGCQRQRGGTSDNPNTNEFLKNTSSLRTIGVHCHGPTTGNCRGYKQVNNMLLTKHDMAPLPKRVAQKRKRRNTS